MHPSLLKSCRAMRTELIRLAGGIASSSSDQVVDMVKKHAGKLTLMGASAKVEVAIMLQLAGDACMQRFMAQIRLCLPSPDRPLTPEEAAQKLQGMFASDARKMAPRPVQESLKHVQRLVAALVEERAPDMRSSLADARLRDVVGGFQ